VYLGIYGMHREPLDQASKVERVMAKECEDDLTRNRTEGNRMDRNECGDDFLDDRCALIYTDGSEHRLNVPTVHLYLPAPLIFHLGCVPLCITETFEPWLQLSFNALAEIRFFPLVVFPNTLAKLQIPAATASLTSHMYPPPFLMWHSH